MDLTPVLIGAVLIGTVVTTAGMFLFVSAQRLGHRRRRPQATKQAFLATGLVVVGATVTMVAWYLWPKALDSAFDPNVLLRNAPPAAGQLSETRRGG